MIYCENHHFAMAKTILKIEGMSCGMCSGKVEKAISEMSGVSSVVVDFKKGTATIMHEDVEDETFIAIVLDVGFRAKVKHGLFG